MKKVKGIRFEHGRFTTVNDNIVEEAMLHIYINGAPYTVTMRTPGHDFDLVQGILLTEDVCSASKHITLDVVETNEQKTPQAINASIPENELGPGFLTKRNLMSVSSCGLCGKTDMQLALIGPSLHTKNPLDPVQILSFFERMAEHQVTFQETGGSHAAAAFNESGECLAIREDIGRHNAVDKVIGAMHREEPQQQAVCLLVSGRVSYEIVSKCYRAGIPCLAAVSAPSSLAIEYCNQKGIQLYGFCRKNRLTLYTPA
jgi:FdhD protein